MGLQTVCPLRTSVIDLTRALPVTCKAIRAVNGERGERVEEEGPGREWGKGDRNVLYINESSRPRPNESREATRRGRASLCDQVKFELPVAFRDIGLDQGPVWGHVDKARKWGATHCLTMRAQRERTRLHQLGVPAPPRASGGCTVKPSR